VDKRPESVENDRVLWTSPLIPADIAGLDVDDPGQASATLVATGRLVHHPSATRHRTGPVPSTDAVRSSTADPCGPERDGPPSPHRYYGDDGVR